ncbi:MAG: ribosome-associated translation inhibitor RaiA [Eubacteriales bacterium]|nr:ribosome-associated translation inhibitor RaiA [Eubacteriales bacterium]
MKFNITGRNVNIGDRTREHIEKKLGKLSKFFVEDTVAHVTVSNQKDDYTIEVSIPIKNSMIRAEESSNDLYVSIDLVEEVLERQIKRHRTRLIDKNQSAAAFSELFIESEEEEDDDSEIRIEKVKRFDFKPMTAEEACLEMELLGHNFFVFKDGDSGETCVVYKRKNGTYGIIIPEG